MSDEPVEREISIDYDPTTRTYRSRFERSSLDPSTAVVKVMAHVCETAETQLDPLYGAVDPEALDRLCSGRAHGRTGGCTVAFAYLGYRVTVESNGTIEIRSTRPAE